MLLEELPSIGNDLLVLIYHCSRQLCSSPQLAVQEPAALFALRDAASDELITDDTLLRKLQSGVSLKLCAAPVIEAADTINKLMGEDKQAVKQATFSLRAFIKVRAVTDVSQERESNDQSCL